MNASPLKYFKLYFVTQSDNAKTKYVDDATKNSLKISNWLRNLLSKGLELPIYTEYI